jgi:hypothetical protein
MMTKTRRLEEQQTILAHAAARTMKYSNCRSLIRINPMDKPKQGVTVTLYDCNN